MTAWEAAQEREREWWGDCTNTADEEKKQEKYADLMGLGAYRLRGTGHRSPPYNLHGKSVLDIGGGPTSLLLKCTKRGRAVVADPGEWPQWVLDRYAAAGIEYRQVKGEDLAGTSKSFDEAWLYNVLLHVENPRLIVENAKRLAHVVRVFEWVGTQADQMHPQAFTKEQLDELLGEPGQTHEVEWERYPFLGYSNVVGEAPYRRMRFHLLGLAHLPTNKQPEVLCCAYTQKVVKLAQMLDSLGHEVIFYGGEGSDVACDEFVQVVSAAERLACYGDYDWTEGYKHDGRDAAYQAFNVRASREIIARYEPGDFLLCSMGNYQKPIVDAVVPGRDIIEVESGIGYKGVFARFRVYESYAWMHFIHGWLAGTGQHRWENGNFYDVVIPNYFDPEDFPYQPEKDDYILYIGRIVKRKGVELVIDAAERLGERLLVAGQGRLQDKREGLDIRGGHFEYLGPVGNERRKELMGRAKVVVAPTYYIEPFGGVAVEAQMCGTPVITTDWGAFAETVLHGQTGYRIRNYGDDLLWAIKNAPRLLRPEDCRYWAATNYSMARIAAMYQEYFEKLDDLRRAGFYQENPERKQLDWLKKWYPRSP